MMLLTSWINEEFGDGDLLDRREKVIKELLSAGDDVSRLRSLMPKVKSTVDPSIKTIMHRV